MKRISFPTGRHFSAVVCLNANLPEKFIFDMVSDLPLLVADGAANNVLSLGIEPTLVIGDMDSFLNDYRLKLPSNKLLIVPDQETNDFEKILLFCLRKKYRDILIFGFHGGELEHTLNNWSVLKKYSRRLNMCIYDKNRYAIPLHESVELNVNIGEIISLIPQPKVRLRTHNLEWELNDEILELGYREGARNVATGEHLRLEILDGELLLFINHRLPIAPIFSQPI
jgi:thiamine pyrophosphokinase